MKIISIILANTLLVAICLLSACSEKKDENTIIVGTSPDNPPYEMLKDGNSVGIDIDIINAIGAELNKKIEIKSMDLAALLGALEAKKVDAVIAGFSMTPEREKRVSFSVPYTKATVAVLVRADDKFKNKEELKDKILGAQLGTIWLQIAEEIVGGNKEKVKGLNNNLVLVQELLNKNIDAVVLEEYQVKKFREKYSYLDSFELKEYSSEFAIAMPKKDSSNLKNEIDNAIKKLKAAGTIEAIEKKWLEEFEE